MQRGPVWFSKFNREVGKFAGYVVFWERDIFKICVPHLLDVNYFQERHWLFSSYVNLHMFVVFYLDDIEFWLFNYVCMKKRKQWGRHLKIRLYLNIRVRILCSWLYIVIAVFSFRLNKHALVFVRLNIAWR